MGFLSASYQLKLSPEKVAAEPTKEAQKDTPTASNSFKTLITFIRQNGTPTRRPKIAKPVIVKNKI